MGFSEVHDRFPNLPWQEPKRTVSGTLSLLVTRVRCATMGFETEPNRDSLKCPFALFKRAIGYSADRRVMTESSTFSLQTTRQLKKVAEKSFIIRINPYKTLSNS